MLHNKQYKKLVLLFSFEEEVKNVNTFIRSLDKIENGKFDIEDVQTLNSFMYQSGYGVSHKSISLKEELLSLQTRKSLLEQEIEDITNELIELNIDITEIENKFMEENQLPV